MSTALPQTRYKQLSFFFLAANSLVLAGTLTQVTMDYVEMALLAWCGICGIFIIYRLNDFIDQEHNMSFNIKRFFEVRLHVLFMMQFFLITLPVCFYMLSGFRIVILAGIAFLGILYSLTFRVNEHNYRLKNIFLVKNLFIGISWGALVLVGAGTHSSVYVKALFLFCSAQVIIGSIIRDIPDIEKDREGMVNSLPVLYGEKITLTTLHVLNLLSLLSAYLVQWQGSFIVLITVTISWRALALLFTAQNPLSRKWTQAANLFTCLLIFIILLIQRFYGTC